MTLSTPARRHRPRTRRSTTALLSAAVLSASTIATGATVALSMPAEAATPTYSLWTDQTLPTNPADADTSQVTLGMKFSSKVDGVVKAIRFFKSAQNTGPHTGQLWTANGKLLAKVNFASSSTAGWKNATLSNPVSISAGTAYVASYVAPHGRYAGDQNTLSPSKPQALKDLTAVQGVYTYGTGFPQKTWNNSNYYVDVRFSPSAGGATVPTPTPSPTPTPTPTPTPAPTGLRGWQLTSTNIGLAPHGLSCNTLPAYTGSGKPAAGREISGKRIETPLTSRRGTSPLRSPTSEPPPWDAAFRWSRRSTPIRAAAGTVPHRRQ